VGSLFNVKTLFHKKLILKNNILVLPPLPPVRAFLRFAMIQDVVWEDFSVSDLKLYYMGKFIIKKSTPPLNFIRLRDIMPV
jgi:hypothetical protein